MASAALRQPDNKGISEWLLGLLIGGVVCALGWAVWLSSFASVSAVDPKRPRPVWVGTAKLQSQTEGGGVLTFQVNLKVKAEEDQEAVQPHVEALQVVMQEVGQTMTREELSSPDGLRDFAGDLRRNVNNYLRQKQVPTKVQSVAFQELFMSS